jgi:hypothetical protein
MSYMDYVSVCLTAFVVVRWCLKSFESKEGIVKAPRLDGSNRLESRREKERQEDREMARGDLRPEDVMAREYWEGYAARLSGLVTGEKNKEEFESSELYREICSLAQQAGGFPWREDSFLGPGLAFWSCSEIGHVAACGYVEDGEFPGSPPVDLTDKKYEQLVEKLRSINGQFVWRFEKNCFPLFYHENLKSTADFKAP